MKPSIKFNWIHEHLILYSSFSNQISLSIGLLPVNDILSNFNLYIFEPSQPIYDYFLSALTSSFHCYIFSIYFFDWFFFCIYIYIYIYCILYFFYIGIQKWLTTSTTEILTDIRRQKAVGVKLGGSVGMVVIEPTVKDDSFQFVIQAQ
jgi:hypothetical protein